MGAASNVFSTMLMQHGQRVRDQQIQDFESRKNQQEWYLKYTDAMRDNPLLDDIAHEQYARLGIEGASVPIPKFDIQKYAKKLTDPIDDYHQRHGAMVAQAFPTSDQQNDPTKQSLQFPQMPPPGPQNSQAIQFPQTGAPPAPPQGAPPAPQGAPQQSLQAPPMPAAPGGDQGAPMSGNMPNGQPAMMAAAPDLGILGQNPAFMDPRRGYALNAAQLETMIPAKMKELAAQLATQNEAQLAAGRKKLEAVEPFIKGIDNPMMQNMMRLEVLTGGSPGNMFAPLMSASVAAPTRIPIDATGLSPEQKAQFGLPADATGKQTLLMDRFRNVIGTLPGWEGTAIVTAQGGQTGIVDRRNPSTVTPLTAPGGGPAINPAMQPTTSTAVQTTPGLPPTTTSTTRVRGAVAPKSAAPARTGATAAPLTPPAMPAGPSGAPAAAVPAGGGAARAMPSDAYPPAIKQRAKQVADGSQPMPTDQRSANAVQEYMAEHNMQLPTVMSPAGQAALAGLDPVLEEVQSLKKFLEDNKLKDNASRAFFAGKFLNYRAGGDTPYNEFFTSASFEGLRSAGQALKGTNSRAYQIISKALVHTPNLYLDSPKNIYEKLNAAEKILMQGRQSVLADERKSGVLGAAPGSPPNPPAGVNPYR